MLYKRGNIWWMRFTECKVTVHKSTGVRAAGKDNHQEAKRVADLEKEKIRRIKLFGERPSYSFHAGVEKYLQWKKDKKSIHDDSIRLRQLWPYLENDFLHDIHNQNPNLIRFLADKKELAPNTRNHYRKLLKTMVKLAHDEWVDDTTGKTWLETMPTPIIKLEKVGYHEKKHPYPLSWNEQTALINRLPPHYKALALFAVNTGARESEYCNLSWCDEDRINRVFWVKATKNGKPRPLVLNSIAQSLIAGQRGLNDKWVFPYMGEPLNRLNNRAWINAWKEAGLPDNGLKGPHNLRHTFSTRLANLGTHPKVKDWLMGHADQTVGDIYTIPMMESMRDAVERLCGEEIRAMTPLRVVGGG